MNKYPHSHSALFYKHNPTMTSRQVAVLTILPSLLYLSLFSLHFSLLTKVHRRIFKVKMEMMISYTYHI